MRQRICLLILFLVTTVGATFACECDYQGGFMIVAPKTQFIALVKVTKHLTYKDIYGQQTPMSMEVEIVEVYKGAEKRKTVKVWGDNGRLCRPYLSKFVIGEYYVIAFYGGSDGSKGYVHDAETTTDYSISICGEYWLNADIVTQTATGKLTDKQTQIKLADLRDRL